MFELVFLIGTGLTWSGSENYDVRNHAVKRFYDVLGDDPLRGDVDHSDDRVDDQTCCR